MANVSLISFRCVSCVLQSLCRSIDYFGFVLFFHVAFQHLHYLGTLIQTEAKMLIQGRDVTIIVFFLTI